MTSRRRLLDVLGPVRHGSRSLATCRVKCDNACDHPAPNPTDNPRFADIAERALSRRAVLAGAGAGAAAVVVGRPLAAGAAARTVAVDPGAALTFTPVEPTVVDDVVVADGYQSAVIAVWGDPVGRGAPAFDPYRQSRRSQERQVGYNADYLMLLPLPGNGDKGLLAVNHEYTNEELMFPADGGYTSADRAAVAMAAHGMSILEVERVGGTGEWRRVTRPSRFDRRITAYTPMVASGPAAGDPRLSGPVAGTLNNCAGGVTPWGTVLTGEENFNQYFDAPAGVSAEHVESYLRYQIRTTGWSTRRWSEVDERFDASRFPNTAYTFGWVVEVDPYDPSSTPVKRTMLGRFKHEGATVSFTADGRVVAYMGDDQNDDYLYKFVSRGTFRDGPSTAARWHNMTLLDHGTLYVAVFSGDGGPEGDGELPYDGTGRWVPLASDRTSYVEGFSVAEVLVNTRLAADRVGATKMDRPEDVERNPVTGAVYACLTNNKARTAPNAAAPLTDGLIRETFEGPLVLAPGNRHGYVLEQWEAGNDAAAETFGWNLFLVCGDPEDPRTWFGGFPKDRVSPISAPDNVTFDPAGNLWVATDAGELGANDGMFAVPVQGADRGWLRQFLSVPVGAECCGPLVTEDGSTAFAAPQHPGEVEGSTFENPASTWPHTDPFPRPGVICVWRPDGLPIGR